MGCILKTNVRCLDVFRRPQRAVGLQEDVDGCV